MHNEIIRSQMLSQDTFLGGAHYSDRSRSELFPTWAKKYQKLKVSEDVIVEKVYIFSKSIKTVLLMEVLEEISPV